MDVYNFKQLLYAIFNGDNNTLKVPKCGVICVYDMKDDEKLIAVFNNSKTCAIFFNTSPAVISSAISRHYLRGNRYKIERVKME